MVRNWFSISVVGAYCICILLLTIARRHKINKNAIQHIFHGRVIWNTHQNKTNLETNLRASIPKVTTASIPKVTTVKENICYGCSPPPYRWQYRKPWQLGKQTHDFSLAYNKTCNVIITHGQNNHIVTQSLDNLIDIVPFPREIIVIDDGEDSRNMLASPKYKQVTRLIISTKERESSGISGMWNVATSHCLKNGAEAVVLLNHDISLDVTYAHLLKSLFANINKKGIYSCVSNKAPFANYINQQTYIESEEPIVAVYSPRKWPKGPGGFCLGFTKKTLEMNKLREGEYFNNNVPWGGSETEFNKRWAKKGHQYYIVHSCLVLHERRNEWLKLDRAWATTPIGN